MTDTITIPQVTEDVYKRQALAGAALLYAVRRKR